MRLKRSFRVWAVLWAVLQFALPAAASYADALLERSAVVSAATHVESGSSRDCPVVHPTECGLCQVLSREGTVARVAELPGIAVALAPALPEHVADGAGWRAGSSRLPRAPPLG